MHLVPPCTIIELILSLPLQLSVTAKKRILHECSCFIEFITSWGKEIKCKACRAFYLFFATSLINSIKSMNVRFYLSYEIKITLKSQVCRKNILILSLCTQYCYGRHNVSRKSVNH